MDNISFRYYIPGIGVVVPVYLVILWEVLLHTALSQNHLSAFFLAGGITTIPATALPMGWWIYHIYKVWWRKFNNGYENKEFINLIKKYTKPFYMPSGNSIVIDLTHVKNINGWVAFEPDIFRKIFYPSYTRERFNNEI